jgi:TRAP-type mannitol/chloroaromatic compound transport system permease small subunit
MRPLLVVCGWIDKINLTIGKIVGWCVLIAVLVSSVNASVRYVFDASSNAWLELQWYLFSAVFLLCASYTHLRNEHIRIDILNNLLSRRTKTWIDIFGGLLFLMPMTIIIGYLSLDMVADSIVRDEQSSNAGGLVRWPVKILIPIGFFLLTAQGLSEVIKRIGFLMGVGPDPAELAKPQGTHPPDSNSPDPEQEPVHG